MAISDVEASTDRASHTDAKRAAISAYFGFFVDMFDIYLPIIALAPAFAYFQPEHTPAAVAALAASLVFVATLLARPLGSILFGYLSDKVGRKPITITSVSGFGVCTFLMALLPGYTAWGPASLYILILLRFIGGLFLGGEYTSANVLAMEKAPKAKRGRYGAGIMAGFPSAYMVITLVTLLMLAIFPAGTADSPYAVWGWRIPFFIGAVIALAFIIPYRASVDESELWEGAAKPSNPLTTLFSKEHFANFAQVFVLMTGFWILVLTASAVLPSILVSANHLSNGGKTAVMLVASGVTIIGYLAVGELSQVFGRRIVLMVMGASSAVLGTLFYYLVIGAPASIALTVIFAVLAYLITVSVWGLATVYINERFQTTIRSSGFGMGYTLAIILPSFYQYYINWLSIIVPAQYAVLPLIVLGGLLVLIGGAWGPETKDVDFV